MIANIEKEASCHHSRIAEALLCTRHQLERREGIQQTEIKASEFAGPVLDGKSEYELGCVDQDAVDMEGAKMVGELIQGGVHAKPAPKP